MKNISIGVFLFLCFIQQAISSIKDDFDIFMDCNEYCVLRPVPSNFISTTLPISLPSSSNKEGVLLYSMTIEDRFGYNSNDAAIIKVGDFAKITATSNYISEQAPLGILKLEIMTSNGVKTITYNRRSSLFNINWLVPYGDEAPTSIKFSVDEIDDFRRIIDVPKIYSVEVNNEILKDWEGSGKVSFSVTNPSQDIVVSWPSVRYGESPQQHHRQKRWSEWHTGMLLCYAMPYKALYNYVTNGNCNFGNMWEGTVYHLLAGRSKDVTMRSQVIKSPIEHRIHFSQNNTLSALVAHTVCGVPLESLARSRQPRDGLDCMYQAQNIINLYILTRLPFSSHEQFVDNLLNGVHIESADDDAINLLTQIARNDNDGLVLASLGAAQARYREFITNHPEATIEQAQKADVISLTCPQSDTLCRAVDAEDAHINIEYPSGATFLADGEDVDFTLTGTINWDERRLLSTHQRLLNEGYVFVGYHGTNHDAARALVSGITYWPRGTGSADDELWAGLYVAANPEVAYGYANPANGSIGRGHRGTMLRVYIPRESLSRLYRTDIPLDTPLSEIREHIESNIGHSMPLANNSITGPESINGPDETVLGWDMAIRSVAIPSMIAGNTARGEQISIPDFEEKISPKPSYIEIKKN